MSSWARGDPELEAESLLGRALAAKTLRDYDAASADLRSILNSDPSGQSALRARLPLAETLLAQGRVDQALEQTRRLLAANPGGETGKQSRFLRAKALLLSLQKGPASKHQAAREEAASHLEFLYGYSGYWRSKTVQLIDAGVTHPRQWATPSSKPFALWLVAESLQRRGECADAVKLYEMLLERNAHVEESRFGLGVCSFHRSNYPRALEELGAFLQAVGGDDPRSDQAAYLRFKTGEALLAAAGPDQAQAAGQRYIELLRAFLAAAPDHEAAYEAWFRLGEWERERDNHAACAEAYGRVEGNSVFTVKAGFLGAQCLARAVLDAPQDAAPDPQGAATALAAVDAFITTTDTATEEARTLVAPMLAKAAVMGAALAPRLPEGTMQQRLTRLEDFEERFPEQTNLLPEVYSLRIVAHRRGGDLDLAGAELENLLRLPDTGAYHSEALQKLGIVFLKEGSQRTEAADADGALRARRVALRIYERLLADARKGSTSRPLAGLEDLVTDLRTQVGPPDATAP